MSLRYNTSNVNDLGMLTLVASDHSYKGNDAVIGEILKWLDDTPELAVDGKQPRPPFSSSTTWMSQDFSVLQTITGTPTATQLGSTQLGSGLSLSYDHERPDPIVPLTAATVVARLKSTQCLGRAANQHHCGVAP